MKAGTIILSIIFLIISTNAVFADRRYNRHYDNHYKSYRHNYKTHRNYYGPRKYYGHFDHHGDYAAYALGGLIIGGILGAVISDTYHNETQYPRYNEQVYVNPTPSNNAPLSYILQPDGSCYVISHVVNGKLVLSPVSPTNCQ